MEGLRRTLSLALCGFGRAGKIHFSGIRKNPRCQLKYVVDCFDVPDVLKASRATLEGYGMLDAVTLVQMSDYESTVLADSELDAVVITTPTKYHESYVKRALSAKKAVFCEKPLAYNLADVVHCYNIAEKHGLPLYCAFQRRFDTGLSKLRNQVVEGKIGKVFQVKPTSRDARKPSAEYAKFSGGMYHNMAIHDIDLLCWMLGEEPVGVFAQGTTFDPEIQSVGDVDTIIITLKFPSGTLAVLDLSRHSSYGYDQRVEVFGEKGMLLCEHVHEDPVIHFSDTGCTASPVEYYFHQRFKLAYEREMDCFLDLVLDPSKPSLITRNEVVLSTRIVDACAKSQREGRMVELDPVPQPS